jgi:hypothetical protein
MSCNSLISPGKKVIEPLEKEVNEQHTEIGEAAFLPSTFMVSTKQGQKITFQTIDSNWQAELVQEGTTNKILPIVLEPGYTPYYYPQLL